MTEPLHVEVCLALPDRTLRSELTCAAGTTCGEAVARSGLLDEARRLGVEIVAVGAWGQRRLPDDPVRDRDRIELYRALTADPKAARMRRVARQRADKTAR